MSRLPNTELSEADRLKIILRYSNIKSNKECSDTVSALCQEFNIHRSLPSKLLKRAEKNGTLQSQSRLGRPSFVKDVPLQEKLVSAIRYNRKRSSRVLGKCIDTSHATANSMRKALKFKKNKCVKRPILTQEHIEKRLQYAVENVKKPRTNCAYLDEKWFECFRDTKGYYRRKDSPVQFQHTLSRRFPPRLMFICVVSLNHPSGKVGIWRVAETRVYARNSKNHRKGDPYIHNQSCDGAFFCDILDKQILPRCEELGITTLHLDNARPHIIEQQTISISKVMERHSSVTLMYQPPYSPDTNPLDEGILKVLADAVEDANPQTRSELDDAVFAAWGNISFNKISSIIRSQKKVCQKIISSNGGNRFT